MMMKLLKNTIWSKNFFSIVIAILIPVIVINFILFYNIERMTERNILRDVEQKLEQNKLRVDTSMRDSKLLATQFANNQDVVMYLYSGKKIVGNVYSRLAFLINNYTYINSYLDSIYIYSKLNNRVFLRNIGDIAVGDLIDRNWIEEINKSEDEYLSVFSRKKEGVYPRVITMAFNVFEGKNKSIGNILININSETFANLFDEMNIGSKFFIVNSKNEVIYGTDGLFEGECIEKNNYFPPKIISKEESTQFSDIDGGKYVFASAFSNSFDWRYIYIIPEAHYKQQTVFINIMLFYIIFFSLIMIIGVSSIITFKTYQPIKNILAIIRNPREWSMKDMGGSNEEIKEIASVIGRMAYSNSTMEKELSKNVVLLNKAQVGALQAQLNPHFIYNTLNAINWVVINNKENNSIASKMLLGVSKFVRFGMDLEDNLIPFSLEMEYTKIYIEIMEYRYDNSFDVVWEIAQDVGDFKILKLSLQPVIENSVYHGIQEVNRRGEIKVIVLKSEDTIEIIIKDNGVGMSENKLKELRNALETDYSWTGRHIGVRNLNQRIKLIFGKQYGVSISSNNSGTEVNILLPYIPVD